MGTIVHLGHAFIDGRALAPTSVEFRLAGYAPLRDIAPELNARRIRTRRGGRWHVSTVRNLVGRIDGGSPTGKKPDQQQAAFPREEAEHE